VFDSIVPTSDGGFVVSGVAVAHFASGFAHVLVVAKLTSTGSQQWAGAYYSPTWGSFGGGASNYPIFQTADGGYTVSGTAQMISSPFEQLFFLMHLDAQGNVLWQKGYGGSNSNGDVSNGVSAIPTSDGGYLLAGYSNIFFPREYDGLLIKTDSQGNIQWQNLYIGADPGLNSVTFENVQQAADGGYVVAGYSYFGSGSQGGPSFHVLKTDTSGNLGTCSCFSPATTTVQSLDLQFNSANFLASTFVPNMVPTSSIVGKKTSLTQTTLFP